MIYYPRVSTDFDWMRRNGRRSPRSQEFYWGPEGEAVKPSEYIGTGDVHEHEAFQDLCMNEFETHSDSGTLPSYIKNATFSEGGISSLQILDSQGGRVENSSFGSLLVPTYQCEIINMEIWKSSHKAGKRLRLDREVSRSSTLTSCIIFYFPPKE